MDKADGDVGREDTGEKEEGVKSEESQTRTTHTKMPTGRSKFINKIMPYAS